MRTCPDNIGKYLKDNDELPDALTPAAASLVSRKTFTGGERTSKQLVSESHATGICHLLKV